MSWLNELLSSDPAHRLGWTLVHSLWEGVLVAAVFAVLLGIIPRRMPRARYVAGCLILLALAAGLGITFLLSPGGGTAAPPEAVSPSASPTGPHSPAGPAGSPTAHPLRRPDAEAGAGVSEAPPWSGRLIHGVRSCVPWLAPTWFIGVFSLSLWHLGGWIAIRRLRATGTVPVCDRLAGMVSDLAARLNVRRPVELAQSALARWPMAVGWIKPVILVPASVLNGLSPDQLGAILAHELAHIRRYDYLVNLLQTVVETLLFHHPAVWWISRQIRNEREHCCDDAVVALTANPLSYAQALAAIAESGPRSCQPAVAAGGGSLLWRIKRILRRNHQRPLSIKSPAGWMLAAIVVVTIVVTFPIGMATEGPARSMRPAKRAPAAEKPRRVRLPHADRVRGEGTPAVLDLASGKLLVQPKTADDAELARYWARLGKGDLAFPGEGLMVLRRGTVERWNAATRRFERAKSVYQEPRDANRPLVTGYDLGGLPLRFRITTAGGRRFDLEVLEKAEDGGIEIEYRPLRRRDSAAWGKAVDGIQVMLRPMKLVWAIGDDPAFAVDIRNNGKRKLTTTLQLSVALEVDGRVFAPPVWSGRGGIKGEPFGPGARYAFGIRLSFFRAQGKSARDLAAGKHRVRALYLKEPAARKHKARALYLEEPAAGTRTSLDGIRETVLAASNMVEITIAPKAAAGAARKGALAAGPSRSEKAAGLPGSANGPRAAKAGCKTPDELARFVIESLSKGDLASLIKRAVCSGRDVAALMGRLRQVLKDAPRDEYPPPFGGGPGKGWHAKEIYADWVRFAIKDLGFDWSKARFERAEYRVVKAKGIVAAGKVDVIFSAGGKQYRMALDDCFLTDRGWLMADGPVWKGAVKTVGPATRPSGRRTK